MGGFKLNNSKAIFPRMEYRVVDVFAQTALTGNPLTVVLDAHDLTDAMMQRIANETNHSETTFVTGPKSNGAWPVRIFTPQTELPFAGHPTLGTAHVLGGDTELDLQVGRIPVRREGDLLWMAQNQATFGAHIPLDNLEASLGVRPIAAQVVSTGTPVGIVQVADSDAVRRANLDARTYSGPEVAGLYVFASHSDHDIHARFFADFVGIPEDAATGGAAGPLAAWLHRAGELDKARVIHQGVEMGRDSRLHIRASADGRPEVGGRVVDVARGHFEFAKTSAPAPASVK